MTRVVPLIPILGNDRDLTVSLFKERRFRRGLLDFEDTGKRDMRGIDKINSKYLAKLHRSTYTSLVRYVTSSSSGVEREHQDGGHAEEQVAQQ